MRWYKLALAVLPVILIVGILLSWMYGRRQTAPFELAMRGSSSSSGQLAISGANIFVHAGEPGIIFGTVRKPDKQTHFTYVIVVKYDASIAENLRGFETQCSNVGRNAGTTDVINFDGTKIEATYALRMDESLHETESEFVSVAPFFENTTPGQVYLLDTTQSKIKMKHIEDAPWPAISFEIETTEDVRRMASLLLDSLSDQTQQFLR